MRADKTLRKDNFSKTRTYLPIRSALECVLGRKLMQLLFAHGFWRPADDALHGNIHRQRG